jgi:hypothetical protein
VPNLLLGRAKRQTFPAIARFFRCRAARGIQPRQRVRAARSLSQQRESTADRQAPASGPRAREDLGRSSARAGSRRRGEIMTTFINESTTRRLCAGMLALALGPMLGAGATRAQTSCVCDDYRGEGGTTGAAILAQLCPDGKPAAGVSFRDSSGRVEVIAPDCRVGSGCGLVYWVSVLRDDPVSCQLRDVQWPPSDALVFKITPGEADACREHLRARCRR